MWSIALGKAATTREVVQYQSTMAGVALLRLHPLYRMLRMGELLALVALVSWYMASVMAVVLWLASSILLNTRSLLLLTLSKV
jgi:hypothetical protein